MDYSCSSIIFLQLGCRSGRIPSRDSGYIVLDARYRATLANTTTVSYSRLGQQCSVTAFPLAVPFLPSIRDARSHCSSLELQGALVSGWEQSMTTNDRKSIALEFSAAEVEDLVGVEGDIARDEHLQPFVNKRLTLDLIYLLAAWSVA